MNKEKSDEIGRIIVYTFLFLLIVITIPFSLSGGFAIPQIITWLSFIFGLYIAFTYYIQDKDLLTSMLILPSNKVIAYFLIFLAEFMPVLWLVSYPTKIYINTYMDTGAESFNGIIIFPIAVIADFIFAAIMLSLLTKPGFKHWENRHRYLILVLLLLFFLTQFIGI